VVISCKFIEPDMFVLSVNGSMSTAGAVSVTADSDSASGEGMPPTAHGAGAGHVAGRGLPGC
jgi:hypothetical protein